MATTPVTPVLAPPQLSVGNGYIVTNTTTTITTTSNVGGQQIVVTPHANTVSIGNIVTDVSMQPYIANRIVSFYAYNMRPNQNLHVFFDNILVDQYCAPGIVPQSITDSSDYHSIQKNGNWGDPIVSDQFGQVAGQFNIPGGTFKTGDRILELADVTDLTQGLDALTTKSTATFTASNLSVTKENVTLTTINPEISYVPISKNVVTTSVNTSITIRPDIGTVYANWNEPIAQGLTINTPSGEAGIFATSLDIFFKQKAQITTYGVSVYLCEIKNGYPDGNTVLPFSKVHLPYANINVSADSSIPTNFKFEAPVFLNNGTEYAFIVKPDAGDPDYFVYSAVLGDIDIQTGQQVYTQPTVGGTAFYGATDTEWTALQTEYLKFELHRSKFTSQSADAYFNNQPAEFLKISNVAMVNTTVSIIPGDYVFQATSNVVTTAQTAVNAILNYYDDVKDIIYAANSSGTFVNNGVIQIHRFANTLLATSPGPNTTTLIASANTGVLYDAKLNNIVPQFATISPAGTALSFKYSGTSNTYAADTYETPINVGRSNELYDYERIVASRSNETGHMSGASSLTLHATMATDSEFLSPIIDTVRNQELLVSNEIDPISFIYEEFYTNGSSKSKYISKIVTLAQGQDAQDLQVILSAYRPPGSDIQVWTRFLSSQDSEPMSNKTWVPMINTGDSLFSNPGNPSDLREFTYVIPQYYGMIPTNGTANVVYNSTTLTGNGTQFGTDVKVGWWINFLANSTFNEASRQVVSIANTTSLTLSSAFNSSTGYANVQYFVVAPPTTPWLSTQASVPLIGTVSVNTTSAAITGFSNTQSGTLNSNTLVTSLSNTAALVAGMIVTGTGLPSNSVVYVANVVNGTSINLSANATSTGSQSLTFTSNFVGQLLPGTIVNIASDQQVIVSVTNAISAVIGTPWSSTVSNTAASIITPTGLSYYNSSFNQYSTLNRFQIKIILQSNDSSAVPLVDDVRALAMQL